MFSLFLLLLCKLSTAQTRHLIRWCPRSVGPDASASTHGISAQNRNWSYHRLSGISEEKRGYVSLVISFCFSSPTLHWREKLFFQTIYFYYFRTIQPRSGTSGLTLVLSANSTIKTNRDIISGIE